MSLSSSVDAARELYSLLEQIKTSLQDINRTVGASSTADATAKLNAHAISSWELFFISRRLLANMKRMGFGEDAEQWLTMMQRAITLMRMVTLMSKYLEASTPVGWAMAIVTGMSAASTMTDMVGSYG